MALKVEETRILTIDGNPIAVETLDPQTKELVALYDHWKQKALDASSELKMVQTAMQSLAAQIARSATGGDEEVANVENATDEVAGDNPDGE